MVDPLTWVLTGIGAYWIAVLLLERSGRLPEFIGTQGPILTVHTQRGRVFLDRLARSHPRFLRAWGNFGVGIALVIMVGSFLFLLLAAVATFRNPTPSAVNEPRNVLVIPGVNEFLPLAATPEILLGLLIGLVVHEGGHGLFCRVGDIDIESMGIALFAILPIGAFVEPDDDSRRAADRGDQTRMFAAGVTNNFAVTLIAFALLFGPVAGSISVAPGAPVGAVLPGSAASDAGIERGDRIVAVGGTPVANESTLEAQLSTLEDRTVPVELGDGRTVTVTRSLLVTGITQGSPFAGSVDVGTTITAVNGTPIHTASSLREAVADRPVATLTTENGSTVTGPVGAYVRIRSGGPANVSGLPGGQQVVITAIEGERVIDATTLGTTLDDTAPNQTISVTYAIDGERRTDSVQLGDHPSEDKGFLGVDVSPGVSGMTVSDFGTRSYPAGLFLGILGGDDGGGPGSSFFARLFLVLQLPLASVGGLAGLDYNFAGFIGYVTQFYVIDGPLDFLGGGVFLLANVLFWTGWINLNLGFFNCIPAYPLDGGHILRMSAEAMVSRLPVTRRRDLTRAITTSVGLIMLAALLLTIFGPRLLT